MKCDRWRLSSLGGFLEKCRGENSEGEEALRCCRSCTLTCRLLLPLGMPVKARNPAMLFGIRLITFSFWMWCLLKLVIGWMQGSASLVLLESRFLTFLRLGRRVGPSWQKCKVCRLCLVCPVSLPHPTSAHLPTCHWPLSCSLGLAHVLLSVYQKRHALRPVPLETQCEWPVKG